MKTAIYIPDDIFNLAEKIARRIKVSRSEFYSRAIKEYIRDFQTENITQKLDEIYGDHEIDSKIDKDINNAQLRAIGNEEW